MVLRDFLIELRALSPFNAVGVLVRAGLEHLVEFAAGNRVFGLIFKVELFAELLGEPADHVPPSDGIHVLRQSGVDGLVEVPVPRRGLRVVEAQVRELLDQRLVEAAEVGDLPGHDVDHFARVFGWEGHARVAEIGDAGDGGVEVLFGEVGGKEEEGSADGGEEVNLVGDTDAGVVAEDFDGLLEAAGKIQGVPFAEVTAQGVEIDDTIFNKSAVYGDEWVEVDSRPERILHSADHVAA